jgi:protein-S-isoprenylcysteine O-methyltransferase Ste14
MGTLLLVVASALWGLFHSLFVSSSVKDAAQRAFGDPAMNWYRLAYNLFAVMSFLPVMALASLLPDRQIYTIPEPWVNVTLFIQLMAVVALVVGVFQTDVWSFMGLRQIMGGKSESRIMTGGLYRYIRHPLYTAGLVFIWLTPAMTLNRLVLYFSLTLYIMIGAYFEERKLLREFGSDYYEYQARTPMLVPFLQKRRN